MIWLMAPIAVVFLAWLAYFYVLLLAATPLFRGRALPDPDAREPRTRFLVAIAAYNEARVIEATTSRLAGQNYPQELFEVVVGADHCDDETAALARKGGATALERSSGPRTGKGAVLDWVFEQRGLDDFDAVVVFDADSQVDEDFLRYLDGHFQAGATVVQGNHIIANPDEGVWPALSWAMFVAETKIKNEGRSKLGLCCKNLGDGISVHVDIVREIGWGGGLTDDFDLRQQMILMGHTLVFEPRAHTFGEATVRWKDMTVQRQRWVYGTLNTRGSYFGRLVRFGLSEKKLTALDAAFDSFIPSWSPLVMYCVGLAGLSGVLALLGVSGMALAAAGWLGVLAAFLAAPLLALLLEGVPLKRLWVLSIAPVYMVWRTLLSIRWLVGRRVVAWVPTKHGQ